MEFTKKMTAGFFGGEGFVLQALTGEGDVFIKAGGTLIKKVSFISILIIESVLKD